jgi:anti-sigma B factor antagonist
VELHRRPDKLEISVIPWGADGARLAAVGDVDYLTAPRLKARLWWVLAEFEPGEIVVDLAGVPFLDSTGRGALLHAWRRARQRDCRLVVVNPQPRVLAMLRIAGVAAHLGLAEASDKEFGPQELGRP